MTRPSIPALFLMLLTTGLAGQAPIAHAEDLTSSAVPALYLDFSMGNNVVNLTPHPGGAKPSLIYRDSSSGYRSVKHFIIGAGPGVSMNVSPVDTSILLGAAWAQVGLVPITGKEIIATRFAKNSAALEKLPGATVPYEARDLQNWSNGDSVSYSTKGGIVFFASAGVGYASVGAAALAQGEFETYVEKIDANTAYVKITDTEVKTLSLRAGVTLSSVSVNKFHQLASALSFVVNTNSAEGAKAYKELILGNIAAAQKIALSSQNVRRWEKASSEQGGTLGSLFVGVPILMNVKYTNGQIQDLSTRKFFSEDNQVSANYGIFLNKQEQTMLAIHRNTVEAFYGAAFHILDSSNREQSRGTFGQYVWTYENNNTTAERLHLAMKEIVRKTGLRDLLPLKITKSDDLDYTNVSLRVNFDGTQTQRMIKNANRFANGKFSQTAAILKNNYFAEAISDIDGICSSEYGSTNSEVREEDRCLDNLTTDTRIAADDMQAALREMGKLQNGGNDRAYAEAYGRFGRAMATNQFTFQLAVLLAGEGVQLNYSVEGSKFSAFNLTLDSTKNANHLFARSSRPAVKSYSNGMGHSNLGHAVAPEVQLNKHVGETPGLITPQSLNLSL